MQYGRQNGDQENEGWPFQTAGRRTRTAAFPFLSTHHLLWNEELVLPVEPKDSPVQNLSRMKEAGLFILFSPSPVWVETHSHYGGKLPYEKSNLT